MLPTFYPAIEALFSDLDGTLIHSEVPLRNAWTDVLARHGRDFSEFDYLRIIGLPEDEKIGLVLAFFGLEMDHAEFDRELQQRMRERLPDEMELMPGALRFLETCVRVGAPIGLITSASQWHADLALERFGLRKYFSEKCIVTADTKDLKARKPDPAPYVMGAEILRAKPFRCVVFEDSPHGVRAGLDAGMRVVAVPHALSPREKLVAMRGVWVLPEGKHIGDFTFDDIAHLLPR